MCFEENKPQTSMIAEKNITVFKCMLYYERSGQVKSPYREICYSQNQLYTAPTCRLKNEGGFYSFKYLKAAKEWISQSSTWKPRKRCKVFKCVIPKGSRYIEGIQDLNGRYILRKAIRSKQIIFKEKLT